MSEKQLLKEVQAVKKLLIFLLVKMGSTSEEIGKAIGMDSSTIRHMVPMKAAKKEKKTELSRSNEKVLTKVNVQQLKAEGGT